MQDLPDELSDDEMQRLRAAEAAAAPLGGTAPAPAAAAPADGLPDELSDDEMQALVKKHQGGGLDDRARGAADALRSGIGTVGKGLAKAMETVDGYTAAPVRAGVEAAMDHYQHDEPGSVVPKVLGAARGAVGHPEAAPTNTDLAAKAGLSTDETVPISFRGPTGAQLKASPAQLGGAAVGFATDPLSYVAPEVAATAGTAGAEAAATGIGKLTGRLREIAGERAVKAGLGQNVEQLRRIARAKRNGVKSVDEMLANVRGTGQRLLDDGTVSFGDRAETIGPKAQDKLREYGDKIEQITQDIDNHVPQGAVDGRAIAQDILDYAASIEGTPAGQAMQNSLLEEAQFFHNQGNISFRRANKLKNQDYEYKPTAQNAVLSDQKASNKVQAIIGQHMNDAAERLAPQVPAARDYLDAKKGYGAHAGIVEAAADREIKNLSNRFVSPSDYFAGGSLGALAAASSHGEGTVWPVIAATVGAMANKVARERGSSMVAATLHRIANVMETAPPVLNKYKDAFGVAAGSSAASVLMRHKLLMERDPEYRALFEKGDQP